MEEKEHKRVKIKSAFGIISFIIVSSECMYLVVYYLTYPLVGSMWSTLAGLIAYITYVLYCLHLADIQSSSKLPLDPERVTMKSPYAFFLSLIGLHIVMLFPLILKYMAPEYEKTKLMVFSWDILAAFFLVTFFISMCREIWYGLRNLPKSENLLDSGSKLD